MEKKFFICFLTLIAYFFEIVTSQTEQKKEERKMTYSETINKDYVRIR